MIIIFMVMLIKTRLAWSLEENVAGTENYSKSHHLNLGTFFLSLSPCHLPGEGLC